MIEDPRLGRALEKWGKGVLRRPIVASDVVRRHKTARSARSLGAMSPEGP